MNIYASELENTKAVWQVYGYNVAESFHFLTENCCDIYGIF